LRKLSNFYLASRFSRREELKGYASQLIALGHEVPARWLWTDHQGSGDGDTNNPRFAEEDLEDVTNADTFIHFSDPVLNHYVAAWRPLVGSEWGCRRWNAGSGGRQREVGYFLGLMRADAYYASTVRARSLYQVGPRESVFDYVKEVHQFDTWEECLKALPHSLT
jgi:hypothetical protein